MKLSVLDQSVVSKGETAHHAFQKTAKLARVTEKLGYTRFWVAEHHNTNGLAGTSPEILISHLAAQTNHIRIGSGGVLLPQYSPYKIAENFKVLEALYPNRIDLGIGRSPGGSPATRLALTDGIRKSLNDFPRQVKDLQEFTLDKPNQQGVIAYPKNVTIPELWHLGISQKGARVAAEKGTAFTYGHFITPVNGEQTINHYLRFFRSSPFLQQPKINVCIFVVCAPSQERAEEIALSQDLWLLAVENNGDTRIVSIEEAKSRMVTNEEKVKMKENRKRMIIGTPDFVKEEILKLSERYQTDEFMILTNVYDFQDKVQSYSLLAEKFL
ncbi:hypothetical protein WQ54_04275 [Bacillus sp. SA1-12]|uniref:LLM class flavin-dependent oxidoreductase n=1 Tax=Bacillus sp. SA1-12 TaxID=1455638 RepID=UPI0006256AD7|nr:LLM class flavin-dependent oxidoreductase [Bacillus sp. SA1-12]KKI93459.1 hypothetical protein WQ54_04275 [Bacillus sp. SA1-12]